MYKMSLLALGLAGCLVSEKAFPGKVAKVSCDSAFECYEAEATEAYGSEADCREELTEAYEDLFSDIPDGCEYNAKNATQCLGAMKGADCDQEELDADDEKACEEIYECDESAE